MPKSYTAGEQLPAADLNEIIKTTGVWAASSAGSDAYSITVTPVPTTYADGDRYAFTADVGNTGAASINVNSLGVKTIKNAYGLDLITGDIKAGQTVVIAYDNSNGYFRMVSGGQFTLIDALQGRLYLIGSELVSTPGAGSVVQTTNLFTLTTGAGSGDDTYVATAENEIDSSADFDFLIRMKSTGATQHAAFIGIKASNTDPSVAGVLTIDHAGFIIGGTTLYSSTGDGTSQTKNSVAATIANWNYYRIKRVGTNIFFYLNGTLVQTHTTNLPDDTTVDIYFHVSAGNGSDGARVMTVYKNYIFVQ